MGGCSWKQLKEIATLIMPLVEIYEKLTQPESLRQVQWGFQTMTNKHL